MDFLERYIPNPRVRMGVLLSLFAFAVILFILKSLLFGHTPNRNRLALGKDARVESEKISIMAPLNLSTLSPDEIRVTRAQVVNQEPDLLAAPYKPSDAVFGRIVDGLPWRSQFMNTFRTEPPAEAPGLSFLSSYLVNPFLLVSAEFVGFTVGQASSLSWKPSAITEAATARAFPFSPRIVSLTWHPKERQAVAVYDLSAYFLAISQYLESPPSRTSIPWSASALNARDLNLRYIQLNLNESQNIKATVQPQEPLFISEYIMGPANSCGSATPCNDRARPVAELESLSITDLPARARFNLWGGKRSTPEAPPQFTFDLEFK